jgi:hypothetical protein
MVNCGHVFVVAAIGCAGCYARQSLIESAGAEVSRSGLEEIDLGAFRTSMPRAGMAGRSTEISFRVFANVPHYRSNDLAKRIQAEEYRLRFETLAAVRQTTREELDDPKLSVFRGRIEKVTNSVLDDASIDSIGLADLQLVEF